MQAKYESKCPACGKTIRKGEEIVLDEESQQWIHDTDIPDQLELIPRKEVNSKFQGTTLEEMGF